ncbi:uncharacterized protein LOC133907865 [Phragmites australis]|uniref:uncharacterized protein LOC133907861 n=1 Tax=Phragmites australis TaxID=29695 RepID=UPI002D794586|nr:uncharacterized protein LOC133907861 [Phragmites australis]XP_062205945.1 uncharacterized protein LOC133907865 [Phragmites australis]
MIDIRSSILWWDEWQLRILVLGSLGLQWFLLLAAPMRKYTIHSLFRRCIWLAYISSDALAIYALATLFSRHVRASSACEYGGKATSLEVLWAPLLLVHLGGRDEITAFNIEDNELWTRHTVTLVSQVTVAVYAFCKSWPSAADRRLVLSAIMLFISGIINFCEKPWALRSASINRLAAMSSIIKGERSRNRSGWERCFTVMDNSDKCWKGKPPQDAAILSPMDQVQMILSDISLLAVNNDLVKKGHKKQVLARLSPGVSMTSWLRRAFELIYTRANVIYAPAYMACDFLLVPALYIAAITLFAMSHKQGYNATDVKMTYILMFFTAVLDALGVLISKLLYKLMSKITRVPALCMTLPDYNLINSVLKRMKPATGWLLKCATCFGYEDYSVGDRKLSANVAEFVVYELLKPGKVEGLDLASYRSLTKPNWALGELRDYVQDGHENIRRSLCDSPFDESVLLWHIATDLCFRMRHSEADRTPREPSREECTKAMSNYMAYLLQFRPEMLMTGSRQHLFTQAMEDLEDLFQDKEKGKLRDIQHYTSLVTDIIDEGAKENNDKKYSLIQDACKLAQELLNLPDEEKRWKLMYGVWMGMLCYSASMCRGYIHAKRLGEGGEFLSYVWIVISLKGTKTLADKLQMPEEATLGPQKEESQQESEEDIESMFG